MVDVHCHILPGLDDGAKNIEDALAMAEDAIADGITHVVGTPHASNSYSFDFERVRGVRDELSAKLDGRLTLASGCDFHLSHENLIALRKDPRPYCVNQKDCLLVEFNEFSIPPSIDQTLHELQLMGIRPIITHPERNGILRTHPERLRAWIEKGSFAQITAGSLTGVFGPGAQERAWTWLGQGLIHIVASDAHNSSKRPLKLRFAYDAVNEQHGQELARSVFVENPLAAFEGTPLPYTPEVATERESRKRKRFLFF